MTLRREDEVPRPTPGRVSWTTESSVTTWVPPSSIVHTTAEPRGLPGRRHPTHHALRLAATAPHLFLHLRKPVATGILW